MDIQLLENEPVVVVTKKETPEVPVIDPVAYPLPIKIRTMALKAAKLRRQGHGNAAVGRSLGVPTKEAESLSAAGRGIEEIENSGLSGPERELIRAIAMETLYLRSRMASRSPNAPDVGWWNGKSKGWAAATARKRLLNGDLPDHLKLIWKAGGCNGAIALTPIGWTVALAMLSPEDIARATR